MTKLSSSASRLYDTLISLQKNAQNGNDPLKAVIARAFGVEEKDTARLLQIYLELILAVKESKQDIENLSDIDRELYAEPFRQLENGFSANSLAHPWNNFVPYLDVATMKSLQFCADTLSRKIGEKSVSEEKIKEFQKEVDELFEQVMNSDIDEFLKTFLLERLEQIRHAILYYRLNGAKGLKDALEKIAGAIFIFQVSTKDKAFNEKAKTMLSKFGNLVVVLMQFVEFGNNLKGLTGINMPLLGGK
jgi:hypothetical protein